MVLVGCSDRSFRAGVQDSRSRGWGFRVQAFFCGVLGLKFEVPGFQACITGFHSSSGGDAEVQKWFCMIRYMVTIGRLTW